MKKIVFSLFIASSLILCSEPQFNINIEDIYEFDKAGVFNRSTSLSITDKVAYINALNAHIQKHEDAIFHIDSSWSESLGNSTMQAIASMAPLLQLFGYWYALSPYNDNPMVTVAAITLLPIGLSRAIGFKSARQKSIEAIQRDKAIIKKIEQFD